MHTLQRYLIIHDYLDSTMQSLLQHLIGPVLLSIIVYSLGMIAIGELPGH